MPFQTLDDLTVPADYSKTLRADVAKIAKKPIPFYLFDGFPFEDVKGLLLLVGKAPASLLADVKKAGGKQIAKGTCVRVGPQIEFSPLSGKPTREHFAKAMRFAKLSEKALVAAEKEAKEEETEDLDVWSDDTIRTMRNLWETAHREAAAQIQKFEQAILGKCKTANDRVLAEAALKQFHSVLDTYDGALSEMLQKLLTVDVAERPAAQQQIEKLVAKHQSQVAKDGLLEQLDSNPFVQIRVSDVLSNALDAIETAAG